ncbi:hypothetical protein [Streptomyces sp.]|nr:hypothetical protein [Streptomyces sp.]HET6354739.1 hypothetical protein [Streptomyces sp.]
MARLKLRITGRAAEAGLGLTDGAGMPLCAAVPPPRIVRRAGS